MKNLFVFILISCISYSCSENQSKLTSKESNTELDLISIPNIEVGDSLVTYKNQTSEWIKDGKLFSGYVIRKFDNDRLMQKFGVFNGRRQNECTEWYPDGKIKSITNYHLGKLHGKKTVWKNDSIYLLVAELNFVLGKAEGEQKKWYPTGELYQILNMKNGREEGLQIAYRKNGALYANYEAKNGRIFGLKKAALCFGLENQKIVENEK